MEFEELKELLISAPTEKTLEELFEEYDIKITDSTMLINKKILVKDFVRVRKLALDWYDIDNIIVDGSWRT